MRALLLFGLLSVAYFAPVPAYSKNTAGMTDVTFLRTPPVTLQKDYGYILVRVSTAKTGLFPIQQVLVRAPSDEEVKQYEAAKAAAYEAALPKLRKQSKGGPVPTIDEFPFEYEGKGNAFVIESGKFLIDGPMRTVLMQVPAGSYVVYGVTGGNANVVTCNCLGTVSFEVRPGVITDAGSMYADKVHKESPLSQLEDNLGPQMFEYGFIYGAAVVPADSRTPVPSGLRQFNIDAAKFRVEQPFAQIGNIGINRLAPIPGLLEYVDGMPVDGRERKN